MADPRRELMAQTRAKQEETSRSSNEATVTKRILHKLRPGIPLGEIGRQLGDLQLSLDTIHVVVPGFPLRLTAEHVPCLHQTSFGDLFRPAKNMAIFRAFAEHMERRGWDVYEMCCGLVVSWPDVEMGTLVLHNWPRSEERLDRHRGYTRIVFANSKGIDPMIYSLEPLDALLDAIKDEGLCDP